jgi:hypothetical protein
VWCPDIFLAADSDRLAAIKVAEVDQWSRTDNGLWPFQSASNYR